jgi:hypothetical protein
MDCKTARLLLEFDRPAADELDGAEHEELQAHIAECPDCGPIARAERRADHEVGKAMRAVEVPADASARLVERLRGERRLHTNRRWLRRGMAAAGIAALLVLGVCLGWQRNQPVPVNLEAAATDSLGKHLNPQPSTVENWFRDRGLEMAAPPDFNYALLSYYDVTEYDGKRVPLLLFRSGNDQAVVRVLPAKQFVPPDVERFPGSGCTVVWRSHPSDKRFGYLVVYTGASLDTFLAQAGGGAG